VFGDTLHVLLGEAGTWMPQPQRHLLLSVVALCVSIGVGLPLGAWLTRREQWAFAVTSVANLGRTVPSLALLALVYPFVGTGFLPAVIALVALGVPPILLATYTGIREVDADVRDAAAGMGLTSMQRLVDAELPVAAPVVLAGVRTSAVQIVASATLAALIGGGGLGELIMAGLTNLRYDLLLAGALLVALLAAATEVGFAQLEKRGLPVGIRMLRSTPVAQALGYQAGAGVDRRRWQAIVLAGAIVCALLVGSGSMASGMIAGIGRPGMGAGGPLPPVVIGSKDFTESIVLAELYAQALEAQGHPVERRLNLGATAVADAALRRGEIDVYPEYTGTALVAVLGRDIPQVEGGGDGGTGAGGDTRAVGNPMLALDEAVERQVRSGYRKRGVRVLASTPFSNGNAIAVTKATAKRYDLETLTDLAKVSGKLRFGAIPGFDTRPDGLKLLRRVYGLRFGEVRTFENGIKYKSLLDGKVDAVYGFETDGQIARDDLVVLRDDRAAWTPYHAAPIVAGDFAKHAGAAFAPTLDAVSALLDAKTMRRLNAEVDEGGREPADVAHEFLREHGMLKRGPRPTVRIGSKDFTEQYILGELYAQALEARGFPVERRLGLGATAVADGALRRGQIDVYPEYTGTAWTAVLKRPVKPGTSSEAVWSGVKDGYAKRELRVLHATPFSNGNAIVVTKQTAKKHDLETLSDLAKVSGELRFGAIPGFDTREDGMPLLQSVYGLKFGKVQTLENGIKYKSLLDGGVDAVYGFETDGPIASNHLVVLRDDRAAWPAYQVAPIVSKRFSKQVGTDFAATLDHVSSLLDAKTMAKLNAQVDERHREPADVARDFLRDRGIVATDA
jgi:osmoprotectant transport system permease protein